MAYDIHVKSMPTVNVEADVNDLPPVDVASLPDMTISEIGTIGEMGPLTLAGIPNSYTVAISSLPDLNLRIREIPKIRAHIPANFRLGFSVLGVELAALNLCGEAQIITEPYLPNPCEDCGPQRQVVGGREAVNTNVTAVLRLKDTE